MQDACQHKNRQYSAFNRVLCTFRYSGCALYPRKISARAKAISHLGLIFDLFLRHDDIRRDVGNAFVEFVGRL